MLGVHIIHLNNIINYFSSHMPQPYTEQDDRNIVQINVLTP